MADSRPSTKKVAGQARPSSKEREARQRPGTAGPLPREARQGSGQEDICPFCPVVNTHSYHTVCPLSLIITASPKLLGASEKVNRTASASQSLTGFSQLLLGSAASDSVCPTPATHLVSEHIHCCQLCGLVCLQHCQSLFHLWDARGGMAVSAAAPRGPGRALASQCLSMLDTGSPLLPSTGACKRKPTVTFSKQVCDPRLSEHCSLYQDLARPCKTLHMELQRMWKGWNTKPLSPFPCLLKDSASASWQ